MPVGTSAIAKVLGTNQMCVATPRRLQVQERLTKQIAEQIEKVISPLGVAVVIEAQ
jgi:GTP cyclohydrolase I